MTRATRHNRPNTRRAATADPATPRRAPGRNDRGLTTLEWLLIVAAVAGLAALAVVLVQNVVDETAEQITNSSARLTAAQVAAAEINADIDRTTNPPAGKISVADAREKWLFGFERALIRRSYGTRAAVPKAVKFHPDLR